VFIVWKVEFAIVEATNIPPALINSRKALLAADDAILSTFKGFARSWRAKTRAEEAAIMEKTFNDFQPVQLSVDATNELCAYLDSLAPTDRAAVQWICTDGQMDMKILKKTGNH
jgi:hypothetical protein